MPVFALFVATAFFEGFTASKLWGWFFVPLGLPTIGPAHAVGIMLMIMIVKLRIDKEVIDKAGETTDGERVMILLGYWLEFSFALAIGWIAHQFA